MQRRVRPEVIPRSVDRERTGVDRIERLRPLERALRCRVERHPQARCEFARAEPGSSYTSRRERCLEGAGLRLENSCRADQPSAVLAYLARYRVEVDCEAEQRL